MTRNAEPDDRLKQIVGENAELKALLEEQNRIHLTSLHQPIERFAMLVARPQFIVTALVLFALWILVNTELLFQNIKPWDVPPYYWLQGMIGVFSLVITTAVLVTQSRQAKLADQRADVQLQITVLIGQRTAKLIELHEELRRDLPNVQNRQDEEAEVLQQSMTPKALIETLEQVDQDGAGEDHA